MHQSMSGVSAQKLIDQQAQKFAKQIADETLSLTSAHAMLISPDKNGLDLFAIAALAKAIACFQCENDYVPD